MKYERILLVAPRFYKGIHRLSILPLAGIGYIAESLETGGNLSGAARSKTRQAPLILLLKSMLDKRGAVHLALLHLKCLRMGERRLNGILFIKKLFSWIYTSVFFRENLY